MTTVSVTDLTNAKTDVDHIAAIATSTALTATDRLGTTKKTLQGAINSISAITDRGAWTTATAYAVKDVVLDTGVYYICITAHTSGGTFAGDSAKWRVYQGDLGAYHSVDVVNDIRSNDFSNRKMIRIATERGNPVYYLDSADTTSADDDFLVIVDNAGNRFKLVHNGTIDVRWAGAVGDGVTDDTAAIQKAFNAVFYDYLFPIGDYIFSNLTLPNRRCAIRGENYWKTALICANPSNTDYGIGSAAYVNNSTNGSEPVFIRDIFISGSNLVSYPLVIYSYFTELNTTRIANAKVGGHALKLTSAGIGGALSAGTLVEFKLLNSRITGGDGDAFTMVDTGTKCTDKTIVGNLFTDGAVTIRTMAGDTCTDNHFYGGSVQMLGLSIGTRIADNYHENTLTLNSFIEECASMDNCTFNDRVTVSFGTNGQKMIFGNCRWHGTADLFHNFFSASKRAIVNGGSFDTATPFVFHDGSSTGWISANGVFSHSDGAFLQGHRQAVSNSIRLTFPVASTVSGDVGNTSITSQWLRSSTTVRFATTLTANRTVTLSTTDAINGARLRYVRTAGGAFTLDIGGLKTLNAGEWCEVEYDGSAWVLTAFGSL